MRTRTVTGLIVTGGLLIAASLAVAQRPGGGPRPSDGDDLVARMMEFDNDQDGKLTRAEVTDARLHRLFDRADADHNGVVTREELTALAIREAANNRSGPPGGGPGGPMGMGPPRPGEILPPMLQDRLELTSEQKAQLADLQKEVDGKLESILNDNQKAQLKTMRERGPGRFGPPGGGGGRGPGPGGNGPLPRRDPSR
jgi:hypothetical protein